LTLSEPIADGEFLRVFCPGASESFVLNEEADDISMAGAGLAGVSLHVAPGDGANPFPILNQGLAQTLAHTFDGGFAGEDRRG